MKNNKKQTLISKEDKTVLQILEDLSKEYDDARRMNDYLSLLTAKQVEVQYEPPSWEHPLTRNTIITHNK